MSAEPSNPTAGPQPHPTPVPSRALAERIVADAALSALAARWVPLSATTPDGPLDAVTRIAGTAALVLLGPPGSGKTTALQVAWHRLARAGLSRSVAPLYIDLAHARDGEGLPDLITRALDALGAGDTGLTPTHILLDNLDRMRHGYLFDDLRLVIDAGGRVGPAAVMACRTDDWAEIRSHLPGVTESHLQPAAPGVVRDALVRFLPAATAEAAAAWLDGDDALAQAVRQPRALGALLDVAAARPPADWHVALFAEALLGRILAGVPSASRALHRAALADVALSAQGRAFIPQVDTMAMRLGVTRYDMLHTGAVVPRGADLEFTEPLLARHCAALALVERFGQMPEALVSQLQAVDDPAVAPLLVHAYALTPDPDRFLAALRRLPAAAPIIAACLGLDAPHDFDAPASTGAAVSPAEGADESPADEHGIESPSRGEAAVPAGVDATPASSAGGAEDGTADLDAGADASASADAAASLRHAWDITHSADVAYALAEVEADRGALADAVQALRWAIDARPDVAAWHDALGQVEAERGRWIEAGDAFAAAHRLAPDDPAIARRLGRARVALGDTAGAIALLERGLAAARTDAAAWSLLARAHEAAGATDAALRALAEALRLDDAWPDDLLLLARLTCDRELARPGTADLDAAQSALARAAGRAPAAALRTSRDRLDWLMAERPRSEKPATMTGESPASADHVAPPEGSAGDPAADRMAAGVPPSDAPPFADERPMPSVADVTRIAAQFAAGTNAFAPAPAAAPAASPVAPPAPASPPAVADDPAVGWLSLDIGAETSEPSVDKPASTDGPAAAPMQTPAVSGPSAFGDATPPVQAWPAIAAADDTARTGSWPGGATQPDAEPSP
ncbi:MAG: tetratricopeptide repeat protein, partial [Ardenticatenales bacterium]